MSGGVSFFQLFVLMDFWENGECAMVLKRLKTTWGRERDMRRPVKLNKYKYYNYKARYYREEQNGKTILGW